jgi:hypothetical protein
VVLAGGSFEVRSGPGRGTTVEARFGDGAGPQAAPAGD